MEHFGQKAAVITGAASGIGRALAGQAARVGMRLVLADIDADGLNRAADELRQLGTLVHCQVTDVSRRDDVEALAGAAYAHYGAVHLLCNNAGVAGGYTAWETGWDEWEWMLGVNLWSVIHGVKSFVPRMLAQGEPCHIVNTSSIAGLLPFGTTAPYQVTKHAVVALSEDLQHDLAKRGAAIGVSVLCPSWVNTRIMEAARSRSADIRNYGETPDMERAAYQARLGSLVSQGMSAERVAEETFQAVRAGRFYILPDEEFDRYIRRRMDNILARRNPA